MKKATIILLALLTILSTSAQQDKRLKGLDNELEKILDITKAPGFAVAIVQGKDIVYAKGFGYRDYDKQSPVDANTLFAIGSCTKAFTSAILGQLQDEDKLSLDDSPIKYIPELRFYNDEMNNNIIIKDLMSHRTGLPRHDISWYFFPSNDRDSIMERIAYQEPFTGVRKTWYYNNFMFLTQGVIAERITSKSWEENVKERFFDPLGMARSNVSIDELELSDNAALGYKLTKGDKIKKLDYYHIAGMSPAGSINSSVKEMSNWLITWINNGKFNNNEIIPAGYRREAISSQMVIGAALPDSEFPDMHMANYGYGWMLSSYRGHYRVTHGGAIDGFTADVTFYPSDSVGIVVLCNQNGSSVPGLVRNTVADRMLEADRTDWAKRFKKRSDEAKKKEKDAMSESESAKVKNTKPSHILIEYEGVYSNKGYGAFSLNVENDSLFVYLPLKKLYLRHLHYDVFEPFEVTETGIDTSEAGQLIFNFSTSDAGDISALSLTLESSLDPIVFKRTPKSYNVDINVLESYVGEYDLSGTPVKIYIKDENTLYLFVEGQPEYEQLATSKHKFSFKTLEGFKIEFLEDDHGEISVMKITQPNGVFTTKRSK
jgi:CubicO group peptidase (beta-lactamase class C family)